MRARASGCFAKAKNGDMKGNAIRLFRHEIAICHRETPSLRFGVRGAQKTT
jgi:hypothetical protein